MITGLEPLLAKSGAAASVRAAGWAGSQVRNRISDKRMRDAIAEDGAQGLREVETLIDGLSAEHQAALGAFLSSPELDHCMFMLATERALLACNTKKSQTRIEDARREFNETLRLALAAWDDTIEQLSRELFKLCDALVTAEVGNLLRRDAGVDPKARARLVRVATQIAAASVRNIEILTALGDLDEIMAFQSELRTAVANLHATMRLPHAGTSRLVPYERLFVSPAVSLIGEGETAEDASNVDMSDDEQAQPLTVVDVVSTCSRTVLLGNPGGGKSTSSLKLVYDVATGKADRISATVPFLVSLKSYAELYANERLSIVEFLHSLCETPYSVSPPPYGVDYLLLNGRGLVIFDGLDELLDTSLRREVVSAVEGFAHRYPLTPILVTSRLVGYEEAPLASDLFTAIRLEDFNDDQVEAYARKWFSLDESVEPERRQRIVESFLEDSQFVNDLRVNPLMLSLMCGIYASENYIPRNRPDVYEKCALLLFDRWDKQRGINAPLSFDAHVQAAMRSLALWLYPQQESQAGLPRAQLISYMTSYLLEKRFDNQEDAENAATEFIDFCKGRAWVLTDVGAELYGFTHRTFLEYFAASQLVRVHHSPRALLDALWEHIGAAQWDVVAQLALQMIGKSIEDGSDDFLKLLLERVREVQDVDRLYNYLSFATRSLEFIVPRPEVLQDIVIGAVDFSASGRDLQSAHGATRHGAAPAGSLIGATLENLPMVARYARTHIAELLNRPDTEEAAYLLASKPTAFAGPIRNGTGAGAGERREFWTGWATDNRKLFLDDARRLSGKYHWIAAERVRTGLTPVRVFLERFGVRGLFDFHQAGRIVDPPIAYDLVGGRDTVPIAVVADLVEELLSTPAPWLPRDEHYQQVYYSIRPPHSTDPESPAGKLRQSAAVLCAMATWEIRRPTNPNQRAVRRNLLRHVTPISDDVNQPQRGKRPSPADATTDGRVLSLLERWLAGEVSFVGEEPSGRRVPEPSPSAPV